MSLTIAGPLIEIGVLNGNRWGIPENEADAVIAGLQGVPLKICSGADAIANEHACDYNNDHKAEIGKLVGAERIGNWINAKAQVTDPVASDKIRSNTWTKHWSIFTNYASKDKDGMLRKVKPLAVTLVRNPAYPGAGYQADVPKISKPTLAAVLEKLDREYSAGGAKNLYPPAPITANISTLSSMALAAAQERLNRKFQRFNNRPRKPEEQLNENQRGI